MSDLIGSQCRSLRAGVTCSFRLVPVIRQSRRNALNSLQTMRRLGEIGKERITKRGPKSYLSDPDFARHNLTSSVLHNIVKEKTNTK